MELFTIYNPITGQVLRSGSGIEGAGKLQLMQGEALVYKNVSPWTHYVDVDTQEEVPFPKMPSAHHIFDHETKTWIDPRTPETEWELVRAERDEKLRQCDWVVTKASEKGIAVSSDWQIYRQKLRDVTKQENPFEILWPTFVPEVASISDSDEQPQV